MKVTTLKVPEIPELRVRKMLNISPRLHDAFLLYQLSCRKAGMKVTFQGLVEDLLKKHLRDFLEK